MAARDDKRWGARALPRLLVALGAAALFASARPARADEARTEQERVLAEALFREGRALLESGDTARACSQLGDSYRLDPRLGTLMNLAACHEMEGKIASAWAEFLDAARLAKARGTAESRGFETTARARAAALEVRLHRVHFDVPAPASDLVVKMDGRELPRAAWGADLPVDAGSHKLEAQRPGFVPATQTFVVPDVAGSSRVIVVSPERALPSAVGSGEGSGAAQRESRGPGLVFWVASATTLVTAAAGTFFGLRAIDDRAARNELCTGGTCPADGLARQDDAFRDATFSTVFFGVAAAGAIVAVTALVWPRQHATKAQAWMVPGGVRF